MAYEYDDDLRPSIIGIFAEAQAFPAGRGRSGRFKGRLAFVERDGYRLRVTPCSLYRCELCSSTSPTHNCPYECSGPPSFCRLCGSAARDHDCPVQRRAEEVNAYWEKHRLEAEERRRGAEQRRREAEEWRAAQKAQREVLRQMQAEDDQRQAEIAARLRQQRQERREADRLKRAAAARALDEIRQAREAQRAAELELPPPTFCPECGSSEKNHECRASARLTSITRYAREHQRKKYLRQRMKKLEAMREQPDTLPTAAE